MIALLYYLIRNMNISSLDDVGRLHRLAGVSARDVGWDESHFGIDVGPLRGTFIPSKPVNPFDLMIGDLGFLYQNDTSRSSSRTAWISALQDVPSFSPPSQLRYQIINVGEVANINMMFNRDSQERTRYLRPCIPSCKADTEIGKLLKCLPNLQLQVKKSSNHCLTNSSARIVIAASFVF